MSRAHSGRCLKTGTADKANGRGRSHERVAAAKTAAWRVVEELEARGQGGSAERNVATASSTVPAGPVARLSFGREALLRCENVEAERERGVLQPGVIGDDAVDADPNGSCKVECVQ